jgi:hypothetical protein
MSSSTATPEPVGPPVVHETRQHVDEAVDRVRWDAVGSEWNGREEQRSSSRPAINIDCLPSPRWLGADQRDRRGCGSALIPPVEAWCRDTISASGILAASMNPPRRELRARRRSDPGPSDPDARATLAAARARAPRRQPSFDALIVGVTQRHTSRLVTEPSGCTNGTRLQPSDRDEMGIVPYS